MKKQLKQNKNILVCKMLVSKDSLKDKEIIFNIIGCMIQGTIEAELKKANKRIRKVKNPIEVIVKVKTANK